MSKRMERPRVDAQGHPQLAAAGIDPRQQQQHDAFLAPSPRNKRRVSGPTNTGPQFLGQPFAYGPPPPAPMIPPPQMQPPPQMVEHNPPPPTEQPPAKKSRTNTPWTAAEEQRLKNMREAGNSWAEIAKTFPSRTEGSVKKHWYKDMHYADFAEDESQALLNAIKEYENNKWKEIGKKLGKPAKACEQYAREHFGNKA